MFEHGANGTLDDLIKITQRNLSEEAIKILFAQLVNVAEYLQKQGVMHRDLKPQNIMLDEFFNVKVIDFGDARKVDQKLEDDDEPGDGQRRDTFVGTVNY